MKEPVTMFRVNQTGQTYSVVTYYLGLPVASAIPAMTRVPRFSTGITKPEAQRLCADLERWYHAQTTEKKANA